MASPKDTDGLLANGSKEEPVKKSTANPLQAAILAGNTEKLMELMDDEKQTEVNRQDSLGDTPLFTAVNKGSVNATEALLTHGAKVDVFNLEGDTVVHVAAREDRSKILPLLLNKTDNVGLPNTHGEAAIHLAAMRGHQTIIERLCEYGADVNIQLKQSTPLHLAIDGKQIKTAIQLVEKGAKLDAVDADGNVPLHLAAHMGFVDAELVKLLVKEDEDMLFKANNKGDTPLHIAAMGGHYKSAGFLMDHGANLSAKNNDGNTPLHLSCMIGFAVTAKHLVNKDPQTINVPNNEGYLPLHLATINGKFKAVQMLMDMYTDDHNLWQGYLSKEEAVSDSLMDLALDNGHASVAKIFVECVYWKKFMMTAKLVDGGKHRSTPMLRLIDDMPEVALMVMDRCLLMKDSKHIVANFDLLDDRYHNWGLGEKSETDSMKKKLISGQDGAEKDDDSNCPKVDFSSSEPFTSDVCALKRCHPLKVIAESDNTELLDHPLINVLLRRKWGLTAAMYFTFLIYYATYICLVCAYMFSIEPPMGQDLCANATAEVNGGKSKTTLRAFIYIFLIIGIIVEFIQMYLTKLKHYVDIHNLCDWFTYVSPILVVTRLSDCGALYEWQYQLGIVMVFVSSMNLIYFIRIIPFLGIYVNMVVLMLRNFLQFFTIMFLFIIVFGVCSFLLLQNQMAYGTPFFSIMKNWVMMVGEMDFTDTFHGHRETDEFDQMMHYEPMTWILYVLFLVFLSLIIMNLLTSLAVMGVESLQADSKYCMMSLQIKLALNVEFALPIWLQHRIGCVVRSQTLELNTRRRYKALSKVQKWYQLVIYGDLCTEDIVKQAYNVIQEQEDDNRKKVVNKPLTRKEVENAVFTRTKEMRTEVKDIDKNVDNIEKRLKDVENHVEHIHRMVQYLVDQS